MKKRFSILFAIASVLLSTGFIVAQPQIVSAHATAQHSKTDAQVPFTAKSLVGEWRSVGCDNASLLGEKTGNAFFQRFYVFSQTSFNVRYSYYADANCQKPLFSVRINGWEELGQVRRDLSHTREILVVYNTILLTADSVTGQHVVSSCAANTWTVGQEYDITSKGCSAIGLKPRTECIGDYELVRVEGGFYYPGFRTENMCTRAGRPTHTQTVGAKKVSS